jgi:hypothetical protein
MTKAEKQVKYGPKVLALQAKIKATEDRLTMLKVKLSGCEAKLKEGDDAIPEKATKA